MGSNGTIHGTVLNSGEIAYIIANHLCALVEYKLQGVEVTHAISVAEAFHISLNSCSRNQRYFES